MSDITRLKQEYEALRPPAERFCHAVKRELAKLVSGQSLTLALPLEGRVKEWDSLAEKIERRKLSLGSVLELDDLVGLRAVFLFRRDMLQTCELVQHTFDVISEEDTSFRLREAEFGYQSHHFVVKAPDAWLAVPSFNDLGEFKAELQIRTIAQHIWASASQQLQYKHEESVPNPVRRTIHRVSALLETVDLEFERVLQEREQYIKSVNMTSKTPLNVDVLARLLNEQLPPQNKKGDEICVDLLQDLRTFDVRTTVDLSRIIRTHLKHALAEDKKAVKHHGKTGAFVGTIRDRIERGVFYTHVGLVRRMMSREFEDKWESYRLGRRRVSATKKKVPKKKASVKKKVTSKKTPAKKKMTRKKAPAKKKVVRRK